MQCIRLQKILSLSFLLVVLLFPAVASAIGYEDFPPELQTVLDDRIAELQEEGLGCVAGRVTFSDGAHVGGGYDVGINLKLWRTPTIVSINYVRVYDGGWFIMFYPLSLDYYRCEMILRALQCEEISEDISLTAGEMSYYEFELVRTPEQEFGSIIGTLTDELGLPMVGNQVELKVQLFDYGFGIPGMEAITDASGKYTFPGLSHGSYELFVSCEGGYNAIRTYCYSYINRITRRDIQMFPNRIIRIEYVYQPNGTPSFAGEGLVHGAADWNKTQGDFRFADGTVDWYNHDLYLFQTDGDLNFDISYWNRVNGFYSAGDVPLESITEADESLIGTADEPVVVGRSYVVRTYEESNYAKFTVLSDFPVFHSITPTNPDPIEYPEWGLTVDFLKVNKRGRFYVEKLSENPTIPGATSLPYYFNMYVLSGVRYAASMVFEYDEADLAQAGITEEGLALYKSSDGENWDMLTTTQDMGVNTLTLASQSNFKFFAMAKPVQPATPDFDGDSDVDLVDFGFFQQCYTGDGISTSDPVCEHASLDGDADVDLQDYLIFDGCFTGPDVAMEPACLGS